MTDVEPFAGAAPTAAQANNSSLAHAVDRISDVLDSTKPPGTSTFKPVVSDILNPVGADAPPPPPPSHSASLASTAVAAAAVAAAATAAAEAAAAATASTSAVAPAVSSSSSSPKAMTTNAPHTNGQMNGHHFASQAAAAAASYPANGAPGSRPPSSGASRPESNSGTSQPNSRRSTPTAESGPAAAAKYESIRWREPVTVQYAQSGAAQPMSSQHHVPHHPHHPAQQQPPHHPAQHAAQHAAHHPSHQHGVTSQVLPPPPPPPHPAALRHQYPEQPPAQAPTLGSTTHAPPHAPENTYMRGPGSVQLPSFPSIANSASLPSLPSLPPPPSQLPSQVPSHLSPHFSSHLSSSHLSSSQHSSQPQALRKVAFQPQSSKPIIMDPPSRHRAVPINGSTTGGFSSPTRDHERDNVKFFDDCTRISFALQQSVPEAVRRTVRDNWEKCLLGSDFHQAFVLNAAIHHSSPSITRRAIADFGHKMVSDCKDEVIRHFGAADLDAVADYIVDQASDAFLDKCLEKRLLTIEAKPLINALARAERLGYEQGDLVDVRNQGEQVMPHQSYQTLPGLAQVTPAPFAPSPSNFQATTPTPPQPMYSPQPAPPMSPESKENKNRDLMQCGRCYRTFVYAAAFQHHVEKNVCSRVPPSNGGYKWACDHCGAPFATAGGLQYHTANKVCLSQPTNGVNSPPTASPPVLPSQYPGPATPAPQSHLPPMVQQHTPTHAVPSPARPSPIPGDPYGHLSPEQMDKMNRELRDAEEKFAIRFQEAEAIPDDEERRVKLDGLKNSFGTKQSMIRKKYGVRLRERRTKAEIAAEKERLGIAKMERERARHPDVPPTNGTPSGGGAPAAASSRSSWTAANTAPAQSSPLVQENDQKRRRLDEGGATAAGGRIEHEPEELRHKLVSPQTAVPAADMGSGGPNGAPATRDPTTPPPSGEVAPTQQQAEERVESRHPSASQPSLSSRPSLDMDNAAPGPELRDSRLGPVLLNPHDDDEDSDSEMEDIPAQLPAHVKQTLGPAATKAL